MTDRAFGWRNSLAPMAALLGGAGTLVCCALPALFVSLGMGSAVAGLVTAVPQITLFSEHKPLVFVGSGVLILGAAAMQWRARSMPCPADPAQAAACRRLRAVSWVILGLATFTWAVGAFYAFLAARLICG